jgi:hypothetical protein
LTAQRGHYDAALATMKASFPETKQTDADHTWLTPVKALSGTLTIESLIKQNIIDEEFASDVLAVDLANPLFSTGRCHLLSMVPIKIDGDWKETFKTSLQAQAAKDQSAQELLTNITDSNRNTQFRRRGQSAFWIRVKTACRPVMECSQCIGCWRKDEKRSEHLKFHRTRRVRFWNPVFESSSPQLRQQLCQEHCI